MIKRQTGQIHNNYAKQHLADSKKLDSDNLSDKLKETFQFILFDLYGYSQSDEHIAKTPDRVTNLWLSTMKYGILKQQLKQKYKTYNTYRKILLEHIAQECKVTTFSLHNDGQTKQSGWLKVYPISVYGWCAHHIAPMFGHVLIAYKPTENIIGLSKLPRIAKFVAKQLMVQEEYTHELIGIVREFLGENTPVIAVTKFRHLCMEMRGVEETSSVTVYSAGVNLKSPYEQELLYDFEKLLDNIPV